MTTSKSHHKSNDVTKEIAYYHLPRSHADDYELGNVLKSLWIWNENSTTHVE
jgi:hypothetical protein